jgi:heme exporter protein C
MIADRTRPRLGALLAAATAGIGLIALALVVVYAPTERVQGIAQRIFYFHVPMAWTAYLAFFVVLIASIGYLWTRDLRWDTVARASVEIGLLFTTLVLITGSLWGKPIWNTWWTWDARLTSTLVLWFIYVAYVMLRAYTPDLERGARFGAVLGILGFLDVPIVHFSVQWWRGLHPSPVVVRPDPQLPPEMRLTLVACVIAMVLLYATFMVYRTQLERLRDENRMRAEELEGAELAPA